MTIQTRRIVQTFAKAILAVGLMAGSLGVNAAPSDQKAFDQNVYALEHALIGVGYELGRVDGVMDSRTEKALRAYQESSPALPDSGSMDDPTLRALGIKAGKAGTAATPKKPTQLAAGDQEPTEASQKPKKAASKPTGQAEEEDDGWFF